MNPQSLKEAIEADPEWTATSLALAIGRGRDYINDLFNKRKDTLSAADWLAVAKLLNLSLAPETGEDPLFETILKLRSAPPAAQGEMIGYINRVSEEVSGGQSSGQAGSQPPESPRIPGTPHIPGAAEGLLTRKLLRVQRDHAAKSPGKPKGRTPSRRGGDKSPRKPV